MRLRRLTMARYGKFTDKTIEFGEAADGGPDLHVIYGPNEAGKSTLLSAFLDLLFGIELQSRYGFLHPYETMRIGGCLELSSGPQELMRVKKPQPTLRDAADQPVAQSLLTGELGGLDRSAYRTMFSLDDETLESGGDSILASNGELGQLLFSASAGLGGLSRTLADIRVVADGFTRPHSRSGELGELKAALATLKQERVSVDTLAATYNQLARARDSADASYDAALAELSTGRTELARVQRLRAAMPRMAALNGLRERLDRFGALPKAPASWQAELPGLEQAEPRHRSATERAAQEVERLTTSLEALRVDEAALARTDRMPHLETHTARCVTAELDLPSRRAELARADEAVKIIVTRIGRDQEADPRRLVLTAAQSAELDELIGSRSGIEAKMTAANDELADAGLGLSEARRAMGTDDAPILPETTAAMRAALDAWRASDCLARLGIAVSARDQHADAVRTRSTALHPWTGDAATLATLVLPDAKTVDSWHGEAGRHADAVSRRRDLAEGLRSELITRRAELAAIGAIAGLLSDHQAAEVRAAREAAWALHRRSLDARTADAFETTLRRDDVVSGTRLGHERDLVKLHKTAQAVDVKAADCSEADRLLAGALEAQRRHGADVDAAVAAIDPALAGLTIVAFSAWMSHREAFLGSWGLLRDAERGIGQAEADAAALRARLREALALAGLTTDATQAGDVLAVLVQGVLDRQARLQLLRGSIDDHEKRVRAREAAVDEAFRADNAWRTAWLSACSRCWLGAASAEAPLGTIRAILAATTELRVSLDRRSDLVGRIRDMENDQAAFSQEVLRLAEQLGITVERRTGPELARDIVDRVEGAARANADRKKLLTALEGARDAERNSRRDASAHAGRVAEMMDTLLVGTLLEVAGKLRDIKERSDLEAMTAEAERELLDTLDASTLEGARTLLDGQSATALEGEEAALAAKLHDLELRARDLFADRQAAIGRIAAVGGDDAAARIEERRRTHLLEVEDKAHHHLRLRVGIAAADRALRAYRDLHRSSMMAQASDAFRLISRNAYRGLGTQPGKDGDVLVALGADGGSKLAADLSKGARFQLYLALRAAGYREFAKVRPTVPFVADDVMETFDDFRAEETLKVLGDMSRLGQVIYLTHHLHLRDIAERAVPGVRLHELA